MADLEDVLNPPSKEMRAQILEAAGEDVGRLEHNLKLLETWVSCQSQLPQNYEKELLVTFLRGCKHDMQRAKKKLEGYFMSRTFEEALFRNRVMTLERDLICTTFAMICPMPEMTPEGYRIIVKTISKDDTAFNTLKLFRYDLMINEFRMHHDALSAGDIYVHDMENLNSRHAAKMLCPEIRKILHFIQNSLPFRLKQMHFVTRHSAIVKMVGLIKQMLSEKLGKRIFIHSNWDSVFKVIPRRLFPSDYGGEKESMRVISERWNNKFVELEGWYQKLDEVKVTGPVPKEFEQVFSDLYGTEGKPEKFGKPGRHRPEHAPKIPWMLLRPAY